MLVVCCVIFRSPTRKKKKQKWWHGEESATTLKFKKRILVKSSLSSNLYPHLYCKVSLLSLPSHSQLSLDSISLFTC